MTSSNVRRVATDSSARSPPLQKTAKEMLHVHPTVPSAHNQLTCGDLWNNLGVAIAVMRSSMDVVLWALP